MRWLLAALAAWAARPRLRLLRAGERTTHVSEEALASSTLSEQSSLQEPEPWYGWLLNGSAPNFSNASQPLMPAAGNPSWNRTFKSTMVNGSGAGSREVWRGPTLPPRKALDAGNWTANWTSVSTTPPPVLPTILPPGTPVDLSAPLGPDAHTQADLDAMARVERAQARAKAVRQYTDDLRNRIANASIEAESILTGRAAYPTPDPAPHRPTQEELYNTTRDAWYNAIAEGLREREERNRTRPYHLATNETADFVRRFNRYPWPHIPIPQVEVVNCTMFGNGTNGSNATGWINGTYYGPANGTNGTVAPADTNGTAPGADGAAANATGNGSAAAVLLPFPAAANATGNGLGPSFLAVLRRPPAPALSFLAELRRGARAWR